MAEVDVTSKNNGHSDQPIPEAVKAVLGTDVFKGAFSTQQMSSAIEKLVERGDKIEDLIMRGDFWSQDHMNSWVRLLRKALHFQDKELEQLLMNHLAGCTAISGKRIDILLRAVVGQYNAEKNTSTGSKLRRFLGMDEKNDKQ